MCKLYRYTFKIVNCYHAVDLLKTLVHTLLVFTGLYCVCMSGVVGFVFKA